LFVGCSAPPQPPVQVPAPEPVTPAEPGTPAAPEPGPTSVRRGVDGRCEPEPRQGTPCRAGDGYCVLSWGEPGGHSTALWCREGRWQLESEVNLPADEG
jgi:hypothetical protein